MSIERKISLDDKYTLDTARAYMTGIEALVRLPMLQHQRDQERGLNTAGFISGYRGSPLGTVDQAIWKAQKHLDKHNIKFVPGVNEDLAATAVWGTQQVNLFKGAKYDGVFSMWYGKGPGVDRSMDVIKHANAFGTSKFGGVLAVAGDDHACKSSTLPHQSEHMFIGASVPVLNPSNVQEVLDLGIYGWELSRYAGCWVALKAITENMDSAISAEIDPSRINIVIPDQFELPESGVHARWPDVPLEQEERLNKYKIYAAREFARVNHLNRIVIESSKPRLGVITTGKAYLDVMQALEDLGIDEQKAGDIGLRVYKVGMSWPLEPVKTHEFARGLEEILVVEEKRSIIEDQLTGQLYNWPVENRPRVIGEFDETGRDLLPNLSELTPAMVARAIASRLKRFYDDEIIEQRLAFYDRKEKSLAHKRNHAQRTPHYCSGCPHSSSTRIPEGSRTQGGIGCHYMGVWQKGDRAAQTFTQMGGEGVTWVGQALFTDTKHIFQNLGDGTYFHSGILAIRQAIASSVNITYKILYNDAVAMTGGQPVDGQISVEKMVYQLRGEGVKRIAIVSDHPEQFKKQFPKFDGLSIDHRDRLISVEKELRDISGTTVIIYQQTCAAEKRRRRKKGLMDDPDRRIFINSEVCEGCGDCGTESNCLSVLPLETELGRKRKIDQSACNKDYSCVKGFCPSFVSVIGGQLKKNKVSDQQKIDVLLENFPEPELPAIDHQPWNIVVTGIGGTGVLTVTALIAMAAHIEGKGCATMNQTGLAQKFGSVVSHVRVGKDQKSINSVRIPAGDADLLLGCDLVVTAADEALVKVNIERSNAVINSVASPTAEFVSNPDMQLPVEAMKQSIIDEVGEHKVKFIEASDIAVKLMGDSIASNAFLLGYAFQAGLVPVSSQSLLRAIELNAVAVDFNQKAFKWGRRAYIDLESVKNVAKLDKGFEPLVTFEAIVKDRYKRLIDYQNKQYADRYASAVERFQSEIDAVNTIPGKDALKVSAARSLYKLMAYKDEYEVARLYSSPVFTQNLQQQFEGDFKLKFHLAPPLLSRKDNETGRLIKRTFPGVTMNAFKVLAHMRFLRGTAFDIFGKTEERKLEVKLITDFQDLLQKIPGIINQSNQPAIQEMLELVDTVRGYGPVKLSSIEAYEKHKQYLERVLSGKAIPPIEVT